MATTTILIPPPTIWMFDEEFSLMQGVALSLYIYIELSVLDIIVSNETKMLTGA